LDASIKSLIPLSQAPSLSYPEIVQSGLVKALVSLLTHDNVDIVIDVVELIHELTEEDTEESENYQEAQEAVNMLINSFVRISASQTASPSHLTR
jgi:beta-catenin-like protein 1